MSVKTFTLNGNLVSAGEDQTILDVCDEQGVPIPRLCHLEGLGEIGACRLCLVEVQGVTKLLPACMTRVEESMVVTTNSERLQSYRRQIVELLFAERNHVCAICVVNGYCELQKLGYAVGMDHVRFPYQTPALEIDASHRRFVLDNNRCVLCQRCVRVCDEVEGAHTWDVRGRGAARAGHHRPRGALGRVADLHELRQVRAGLPDGRPLREGPAQGRDDQEPRLPRLHQDRAGEEAMDPVKPAAPAAPASPASPPPGSAAAPAATCRSSTSTSG